MSAQLTNSKITWFLTDLSEDASSKGVPVKEPFMIGRRESADMPLSCISVSGAHAELDLKGDELWITNLTSTNGTFVNGTRISNSIQLKADDIVQFGSMVFKIDRQGGKSTAKRSEMQTVESDIPESAQGRFARLLRVGVVPFFQPVFDLTEAEPKLRGYEVLGRGRLPGLCTPDEMFTAAKEMEKTAELSESLRKRGIEVADINFSSGKMIFVNTHPSEISSGRLGESLARIRAVQPDRNFTIELPAAILEIPEAMSVVQAATEGMNIDLSIYGFQAKSIRLSDLQRMRPKVVKFSNGLVSSVQNADSTKQKLIQSMVKMLVELDIQPMAERVETVAEHEALKRLGFQLAQGFYYGLPSSVEDCCERQGVGRNVSKSVDRDEKVKAAQDYVWPKSEIDADALWLLDQPTDNYTLQIMVSTSKRVALEYINAQDDSDLFKVVSGMGTRRHLFSVFHGSFSDRAVAKEMAKVFKNSTCCPLVRKFASVQVEVKKATSTID